MKNIFSLHCRSFSPATMVVMLISMISCTDQNNSVQKSITTNEDSDTSDFVKIYSGTLRGDDSEDVQTLFKIGKDYQYYSLEQIYPGKSEKNVSSGHLNTERGYEEDRNAVVYVLDDDKPEREWRFFVCYTSDTANAFALGNDRKPLNVPAFKRVK